VKLFVDMPLSPDLAQWLIDEGHDAIHARDIGFDQASDAEIVAHARREARTIITADLDYPRLLALAGSAAPSLILFRGGEWSEADVKRRISELLKAARDDIQQSIFVVERGRLRRRRLPIKD
jgi:predicted nuclease of predicted toxin-antitoxin system